MEECTDLCRDVRSADQKNKLSEADIESKIVKEEYYTLGQKTTACVLTLENGFEVTGISACVCAKNYSQEIGAPYARKKAVDLIWSAEAYLLQQDLADLETIGKLEEKVQASSAELDKAIAEDKEADVDNSVPVAGVE